MERHGDLRVEVDARDVPETLPIETSLCLFRVAQEALNNAVRHAGASAVSVLLSPRGKGLQLAVSDKASASTAGSRDRASLGLAQHARARPASARRDRHREHAGARYYSGRVGARVTCSAAHDFVPQFQLRLTVIFWDHSSAHGLVWLCLC